MITNICNIKTGDIFIYNDSEYIALEDCNATTRLRVTKKFDHIKNVYYGYAPPINISFELNEMVDHKGNILNVNKFLCICICIVKTRYESYDIYEKENEDTDLDDAKLIFSTLNPDHIFPELEKIYKHFTVQFIDMTLKENRLKYEEE